MPRFSHLCNGDKAFLEVPGDSLISCPFQLFLHSLPCGPLFLLPSQQCRIFKSLSDSDFLPPSDEVVCGYIESTLTIQDNLPISRFLIQSELQSPFCYVWRHTDFGALGCGHLWEPLFCLPQGAQQERAGFLGRWVFSRGGLASLCLTVLVCHGGEHLSACGRQRSEELIITKCGPRSPQ